MCTRYFLKLSGHTASIKHVSSLCFCISGTLNKNQVSSSYTAPHFTQMYMNTCICSIHNWNSVVLCCHLKHPFVCQLSSSSPLFILADNESLLSLFFSRSLALCHHSQTMTAMPSAAKPLLVITP